MPSVVGFRAGVALVRVRGAHCATRVGTVSGPHDTPAIVTAQARRTGSVLDPEAIVRLTVRRGVPYLCNRGDPTLTVLRISCRRALRLYQLVYVRAVRHGTARALGFSCRYLKRTAIPEMGGGEVACRGHTGQGRRRLADIYYTPPR